MTDTDNTGPLRRICWVFPDRESTRQAALWRGVFWTAYERVAAELGMAFTSHAPDAVAVDALDPGDPRVFVDGERVTPADTVFITALYSLPYQGMDVFNQYAVYAVLENSGFYLPAPPRLSGVVNDKLATYRYLADAPIPPIPTIRIGCGRDVHHRLYEPVLERLTFPAIVKPAGWASGWGICVARDVEDLRGLVSLAQGGETTLVCQPYLGAGTSDYRVYVVDGEPRAVLRRSPRGDSPVSSGSRGGTMGYVPMPAELADAVGYFADRLRIPYFCADFLHDGTRFWFSEIETDGAIAPDGGGETAIQYSIIRARFEAYRGAHATWLSDRPVVSEPTRAGS
ncbi:RimK family alpha-L-glutamate ligase [Plantactinospora sp. GCM10030261]|uniref:ATP-grasp domain-containing protein n=1 Tax=Plantactinospora sp. GCM10030261 TaxID=3273420 RepID=UPI0036138433